MNYESGKSLTMKGVLLGLLLVLVIVAIIAFVINYWVYSYEMISDTWNISIGETIILIIAGKIIIGVIYVICSSCFKK